MAGDHRATASHNIEVLHSAGFTKKGNASIFVKGSNSVLSPAVSCGQGGHYWFDIREVNVEKIQGNNAYILIRIVPDMFILVKLKDFSLLLSEDTKRYRKNSGAVWGFYTSINITEKRAKIVSSADSSLTHSVQIFDLENIAIALTHLI